MLEQGARVVGVPKQGAGGLTGGGLTHSSVAVGAVVWFWVSDGLPGLIRDLVSMLRRSVGSEDQIRPEKRVVNYAVESSPDKKNPQLYEFEFVVAGCTRPLWSAQRRCCCVDLLGPTPTHTKGSVYTEHRHNGGTCFTD